jgi:uncharacterized protein (TIGR02646 family)
MRLIAKKPAPPTVTDTQRAKTTNLSTVETARTAYGHLDKKQVRAQLATEQGHLCAFCMRRIAPQAKDDRGDFIVKVAHRVPLSVVPARAVDWSNLLGSCDGGQRSHGHHRTCDFAQGDIALRVDPTQRLSVSQLRYERRVERKGLFLTSDDPELRRDVEETLRLNDGDLPAVRQASWDAFLVRVQKRLPNVYGSPARRQVFDAEASTHGARLPEWYGVLEKQLGVF